MAADRRETLGARLKNLDGAPPLTLAFDDHALAGKRERHVERAAGAPRDAVAAMAKRVDGDRLSHSLRQAKTRGCQSRQRSARG